MMDGAVFCGNCGAKMISPVGTPEVRNIPEVLPAASGEDISAVNEAGTIRPEEIPAAPAEGSTDTDPDSDESLALSCLMYGNIDESSFFAGRKRKKTDKEAREQYAGNIKMIADHIDLRAYWRFCKKSYPDEETALRAYQKFANKHGGIVFPVDRDHLLILEAAKHLCGNVALYDLRTDSAMPLARECEEVNNQIYLKTESDQYAAIHLGAEPIRERIAELEKQIEEKPGFFKEIKLNSKKGDVECELQDYYREHSFPAGYSGNEIFYEILDRFTIPLQLNPATEHRASCCSIMESGLLNSFVRKDQAQEAFKRVFQMMGGILTAEVLDEILEQKEKSSLVMNHMNYVIYSYQVMLWNNFGADKQYKDLCSALGVKPAGNLTGNVVGGAALIGKMAGAGLGDALLGETYFGAMAGILVAPFALASAAARKDNEDKLEKFIKFHTVFQVPYEDWAELTEIHMKA